MLIPKTGMCINLGCATPSSEGSADVSYVFIYIYIMISVLYMVHVFYVLVTHISIAFPCSKQLEVSIAVHWPCRSDWNFGRFRLRGLPPLAVHESLLCRVAF